MRSSLLSLALASLVLFGLPIDDAEGQSIPSPFTHLERKQEVGLFAGYMDAAPGRFGFGPSGGALYGGRWGMELSGPLSIEGVATLVDGSRSIINPGRDEGDRVVGEGDLVMATVDARLKFSVVGRRAWNRLSPFVVLGGGLAFDLAGSAEAESDLEAQDLFDFGTSFFGTFGVGTRFFMTETLALRLDGIFSLWKLDTPPGFSDPLRGFTAVDESEWARGLSITVSMMYRW